MVVYGQEASRVLGSAACSEFGLPTSKKSDGFAETQAATWHQCRSGDGENTVSSEGDKMSLSCPSLDPELELIFLPFKDFSAPLFYNKASLIL